MLKLHVPPAPRRPKLTEDERVVLVNLLAAHPKATLRAIASKFEARAGRPIAMMSVRRVRLQGYHPPATGRGRCLTEPQRARLERLCREHREATDVVIARLFTAAAGRTIAPATVWMHRERLGLRPAKGRWRRPDRPDGARDGKAVAP